MTYIITVKLTELQCSEKAIQSFQHRGSFYSKPACDFSAGHVACNQLNKGKGIKINQERLIT